jgi:hypothetical protein
MDMKYRIGVTSMLKGTRIGNETMYSTVVIMVKQVRMIHIMGLNMKNCSMGMAPKRMTDPK